MSGSIKMVHPVYGRWALRGFFTKNVNTLRAYYFVFEVMNIIFPYDFILISLNNRIIRLFFETKN